MGWGPTDPQNYMGYAPDSCYTEFSTHQFGRMHCWFDAVLTSWSCIGSPGEAKFNQPPDNTGEIIASDLDWSDLSPNVVNADDFVSDGRVIHGILWWGSDLAAPPNTGATSAVQAADSAPRRAPTVPGTVIHAAAAVPTWRDAPSAAVVGGDTCATATAIASVPYSDTGNTCAFVDDYDEICPFIDGVGARDVVYAFTPAVNTNAEISLCADSAYDTKLYVYENACGPYQSGVFEACNDDLCSTPSFPDPFVSAVSVQMTAGNTYYVVIDGWSPGDCGDYTLDITPIVCGDGSVGPGEECDPPDGVTCNASCQSIICGDGVVEGTEQCDPPNGYDCSNTCQLLPVFPIDGWLISFHEPLSPGGSAQTPLGLYFCDRSVVAIRLVPLASCDARPVNEYRVDLANCCLIHAYPDSRNSVTPALPDGFHETACFAYDLDIQAIVGRKWVDSGGTCVETPTANAASGSFWGWHSTGQEIGTRAALQTSLSMSGPDWLYGPWSSITPTCSAPNMAFQLLTETPEPPGGADCDGNGVFDVCELGVDCQPNGVFDTCDIADGTSNDCQPNTIPDECDIASGAADCQSDGVPDECQLAGNDTNANGVPDECDPQAPLAGPLPSKNRFIGLSVPVRLGASYSVDDGTAEDTIGVGDGANGQAFGWANRFTNTSGAPLTIAAVEVAFGVPGGAFGVVPGDAVDAVIWVDAAATGNMTNAVRVARWSLPGGVHANNGTFATHYLPTEVIVPAGADFYVGMGDLQSLDNEVRFPAALDSSSSAGRSWAFFHDSQNIFDPDNLGTQIIDTIDNFGLPGNWLVRARLAAPPATEALAVRMIDLQSPVPPNLPCCPPPNFSAYEVGAACTDPAGCVRWVGEPAVFYNAAADPDAAEVYYAARLQCTPVYRDWSSLGTFHVYGAEVVPSSRYHVEAFASTCMGNEGTCTDYSPPLELRTARWADVASPFQDPGQSLSQPNALDVTALVNKFKELPGAISAVSGKIRDDVLNLLLQVDALDIANAVNAFKSQAYPFGGPCPCPPTVSCDVTPCANNGPCGGGLCVRTCSSGPRQGEFCANNDHCGACAGGSRDTLPCDVDMDCPGGTCSTGVCGPGFCRDRCGRCSP